MNSAKLNVMFDFIFFIFTYIKLYMSNRNPIKQWEVTFPQSGGLTKNEFIERFPPSDYVIVCSESHADGGVHLHAGFKFKKGISHSKLIKYLTAKFPEDWKRIHISSIKNWANWQDYCKKEDPLFVERGTLSSIEGKLWKIFQTHHAFAQEINMTFDDYKREVEQKTMSSV